MKLVLYPLKTSRFLIFQGVQKEIGGTKWFNGRYFVFNRFEQPLQHYPIFLAYPSNN